MARWTFRLGAGMQQYGYRRSRHKGGDHNFCLRHLFPHLVLATLLLCPLPASALSIAPSFDWANSDNYTNVVGLCTLQAGLGCYYTIDTPLIDPLTGNPVDPLPAQPMDRPDWLRAAVYTATGTDPGELFLTSKTDGDTGGENGFNGLTIYDDTGTPLNNLGGADPVFGEVQRGYWEYTGPDVIEYFVVKTDNYAIVWEAEALMLAGTNDGDPSTPPAGIWDQQDLGQFGITTGMSHISVYSRVASNYNLPVPGAVYLMLPGLLLMRRWRRRRQ